MGIIKMILVSGAIVFTMTPLAWGQGQRQDVSGVYVNVFAGAVTLDSTVEFAGTSTRPAAKFVDVGGDGLLVGGRVGFGRVVTEGLYLGAEFEGMIPHNVTSRLQAFGVEYRARMTTEFGAYARLGFTPDGRNLVFARAGVSVPRQAFESVGNVSSSERWTPAPAIGAGAEVAITSRTALRFDTTYSFPTTENAIESFRFTIGLTRRF